MCSSSLNFKSWPFVKSSSKSISSKHKCITRSVWFWSFDTGCRSFKVSPSSSIASAEDCLDSTFSALKACFALWCSPSSLIGGLLDVILELPGTFKYFALLFSGICSLPHFSLPYFVLPHGKISIFTSLTVAKESPRLFKSLLLGFLSNSTAGFSEGGQNLVALYLMMQSSSFWN